MIKRAIVLAAAGLVLAFVGYRIYLALLSDETRIRRMVGSLAGSFNDGAAGAISSHLTDDFVEEGSGMNGSEVRSFLIIFFRQERDEKTGEGRYVVEVAPGDVAVKVERGEAPRAELTVTGRFFRRRPDGPPQPYATVLFTASAVPDGGAWKIRRARHQLLEGRLPF